MCVCLLDRRISRDSSAQSWLAELTALATHASLFVGGGGGGVDSAIITTNLYFECCRNILEPRRRRRPSEITDRRLLRSANCSPEHRSGRDSFLFHPSKVAPQIQISLPSTFWPTKRVFRERRQLSTASGQIAALPSFATHRRRLDSRRAEQGRPALCEGAGRTICCWPPTRSTSEPSRAEPSDELRDEIKAPYVNHISSARQQTNPYLSGGQPSRRVTSQEELACCHASIAFIASAIYESRRRARFNN